MKDQLKITPELSRLIGYYLSEGSTDGFNILSFCFSQDEEIYIQDVQKLMKSVFNLDTPRIYKRPQTKSLEITFYSKILAIWFSKICYLPNLPRRAPHKRIPGFTINNSPDVRAEVVRGWYRGDKGYTSSRTLMNQVKAICLSLGIIPSIIIDKKEAHKCRGNHKYHQRVIQANHDSFSFSFTFFDDKFSLKKEIKRSQTKLSRRHGWMDDNYVYLPIKEIKPESYKGYVYNLDVEVDNSYVTEFAAVHNCWTPWFSLFGSMSGYDSLTECFGSFAERIYAIETGLSSNPAMNWRIKELDTRTIISSSDAHSGPKLMREATIFEIPKGTELSFKALKTALQNYAHDKSKPHIAATLEFYPEEGKYHFSGHRSCNIRWSPEEVAQKGLQCPVCGKNITVGVLNRVETLAGRTEAELKLTKKPLGNLPISAVYSDTFPYRPPYLMLVPLSEILAEALGVQSFSQRVKDQYNTIVAEFGGEFNVLVKTSQADITKNAGDHIAEGVAKVRSGDITIIPGYDGVFGTVKVWPREEELKNSATVAEKEQLSLF